MVICRRELPPETGMTVDGVARTRPAFLRRRWRLIGMLMAIAAAWVLASLVSGSTAIGLQAGFPAAEAVLFLLSLLVAGLASLLPVHYLLRGDIAALLRE